MVNNKNYRVINFYRIHIAINDWNTKYKDLETNNYILKVFWINFEREINYINTCILNRIEFQRNKHLEYFLW